jgi:hypothetical protein
VFKRIDKEQYSLTDRLAPVLALSEVAHRDRCDPASRATLDRMEPQPRGARRPIVDRE